MSLVLYRIHQATNKLLMAATISKSATNHWLILSQSTKASIANVSSSPELPPPQRQTETTEPDPQLPGNLSFVSCNQEKLIERIISRKFLEIAKERKNRRSLTLDNQFDNREHNMSKSGQCSYEETFLQSVVEKVFSVSQLKCRRKKKLVRLWHKPTPEPLQSVDMSSLAPRLENII